MGITGGDRVVELGAASVAELLAEPAVALPAAKGRCAELAFRNLGTAGTVEQMTLFCLREDGFGQELRCCRSAAPLPACRQ